MGVSGDTGVLSSETGEGEARGRVMAIRVKLGTRLLSGCPLERVARAGLKRFGFGEAGKGREI